MNKKKIALIVFWFITIVGFEFVYRWALLKGGFHIDGGLLEVIVFSLPIVAITYTATTLFSEKINKRISTAAVIFFTFLFLAQLIYFKVFNSVFSVYSMTNGGQVLEFWRTILSAIVEDIYRVLLLLIPITFYFIFGKKVFDFSKNKAMITGISFAASVFLFCTPFIYLSTDKKDIYSSYNLYFNTQVPVLSAKKFGLVTTMGIDLNRSIFGMKKKVIEISIEKKETNTSTETAEYNNLDIDFESLINNETDSTLISMDKYFESLSGTKKNEYTGMFKGKNVIFVLAESLDPLAINSELTPTLYKLANSGFDFKNYYAPLYPASTADGEFRTEWSLISSRGDTLTLYAYKDVYSPYIFSNSFSDYNINVYHNYNGDYYHRREYFSALGYQNFKSCYYGLNLQCGTFHESDLDMVDITTDEYIDSENPFFAYYITLSGHLSYLKNLNKIAIKNWDLVKDLPYSEKIKSYLAGNIELDKALQLLIERLTAAGKLDDTVIVVTPDHYPYGLKDELEEVSNITGMDKTDTFEMYHSDLIIWNSEMENKITVNKVGSNPDVLPTLLNLFGVDYDSRMIIGQDLLSDSEGLVLLANRSWITDKGRYNSVTGVGIGNDNKLLDETYITKINTKTDNAFKISNLILDNNYYAKIFNQEK